MSRLTDDRTAEGIKRICDGLIEAGAEPSMADLRYVKLAEYESTGYEPEEIRDILKSDDAEREPPKEDEVCHRTLEDFLKKGE